MKQDIYNKIYKKFLLNKNKKFLIIEGVTCSGKTSFAKSLNLFFKKKGVKSIIISKDLFLKSRKHRINLIKNKKKVFIDQNSGHYDTRTFKKLLNILLNENKKRKRINLNNLYNRKSGLNNLKIEINVNSNTFYIIEGLYVLKDIPKRYMPNIKIFLIHDLYYSLSKKLQRIRDNQISLEDVIYEYKNIHLRSFLKYLTKYKKFDFKFNFIKNFDTKFNSINNQIDLIKNFLKKH